MLETAIVTIFIVIVAIAILYIISIWVYKRAPANMGFIRTGFLGTKVCLGRGAIVLPVFHEITWISLETIKLIVSRAREQAILTSDNIRVDVGTELYAHVGRTVEDMLTASRSLGDKTFDPDRVRDLLEAKVVSALRSYAATKTLKELHENRDAFAREIKSSVVESFKSNGLSLEEVTIVTLEQTGKDHFKTDNVFDAEGLKIITEITSNARKEVHNTEKRTDVSIRQKDLDTQLELLEIERQEAFARASQDKEISNDQALQVGQKQIYVLDQRKAVEEREIQNDLALERMRTEREIAIIEEAQKREASEIQKALVLEREQREKEIAIIGTSTEQELTVIRSNVARESAEKDRQIALTAKAEEYELAEIARSLARERAEKDREIELASKERERQQAEIQRDTAVAGAEETARIERHLAAEKAAVAMGKRSLETKLAVLDLDKEEAFATTHQEQDVSNERARVLSEKQQFILEQRWQVQEQEINKELALEKARVQQNLAVELEEREREIALITKEQQRESTDIQRFLAREREERDREIVLVGKARELELVEIERLETTAERERAEKQVESVRMVLDAEREKTVERIEAEKLADSRRIEEENRAEISRMHMISQSEARKLSAEQEADATLTRARATSQAQEITAEGIEREAGAQGRAEMEIEGLRVQNKQRMLEAEAAGIEAKADALKKYNEAATFLELAQLQIAAERDVHIDQAKAMGNALQGAQIRMYGGDTGTVDTIHKMFTSGFGMGEVLEGIAHSLPEGMRERLTKSGIRGLFGPPQASEEFNRSIERLGTLVRQSMRTRKSRDVPLAQAIATLQERAGDDEAAVKAVGLLKQLGEQSGFDQAPFEMVWSLLQALSKSSA